MPTSPTESARPSRRADSQSLSASSRFSRQRVAIARFDAALDAAAVDVDGQDDAAVEGDGERLRAAHAAHAAGDDELALSGFRRSGARPARRMSGTCPAKFPACRCRSSCPAVIWPYIIRPLRSSSLKCSQLAHLPTRLELAMMTRGAISCVGKTATGLPDWTSSVSSGPRRSSSRTMAWKHSQLRAALPMPP